MDKKRTLVISLPSFAWKNLLSARGGAFLAALFLVAAAFFWWFSIRPYLWISNARVEAFSATLSSDAAGRIVETGPEVGEAVKKGELLFALDADLIRANQKRLHLCIETLNEQVRTEKMRMDKAVQDYVSSASETEMAAGGSANLQKHLAILEDAQSKSEKATMDLQAASAELAILELQAKKMRLDSPFDGIVLARSAQTGAAVPFGHPVYTICDPKRTWIEVEVPEKQIRHAEAGAPVRIRFPAYPKKEYKGRVISIGPSVNQQALQAKISLDSSDVPLRPGLSAEICLKVH